MALSVEPLSESARVVASALFVALMVIVYLPVGLTGCGISVVMSSLLEHAMKAAPAISRAARVLMFVINCFIVVSSLFLFFISPCVRSRSTITIAAG